MADAPVYVLGTGLSHNGSAVLLKDGQICVGIEKERITRRKHDGGNDSDAIRYCLDAEGITLADVALVVQSANFEVPPRDRFHGSRLFAGAHPPLLSISHHLAHAWSAAGTTPFADCAIMVIDGCGSPASQCTDIADASVLLEDPSHIGGMWCEKDSFYHFDGRNVVPLAKDFSPIVEKTADTVRMPTTQHSIGGFYSAVSHYVFGNLDDAGKLMGLAPYGKPGAIADPAFAIRDGRLFVEEAWKLALDRPSAGYADFRASFQYYADIAFWAQQQVEQAVAALFHARQQRFPTERICYTGGVALNAVANARLLDDGVVRELYMEPAAGDNGLALGCAFYGWMHVLGREKVPHDGSTCFGKSYTSAEIREALADAPAEWEIAELPTEQLIDRVATLLADGKTIGWFRDGCEFGPRALGHRSILAHPGVEGIGDHINANIKFREDFRPFAPAILPEFAETCFESGRDSPYMILVDRTKPEHRAALRNVTHVNGSARVQTVDPRWNAAFFELIRAFHALSGIPVLLNTSFNKRGMPIVERPEEAVALFAECALDALVLQDVLIVKR
ncbi:MAG: transferase [Sphingomonadales bacterium]|nr:MAG: transferase [Sphingomonadales bacterium]